MSTEVVTRQSISTDLQEKVLLGGDLSKLTAGERLSYYNAVCTSVGLNPLTRPFEYLYLNSKMVLYARKDCTDQLRDLHGISVEIVGREVVEGIYVVTARAKNMTERTDESIGAVPLPTSPADKANAMMKAETKSKRRVTLSICGLGILDETEIDTIPGAKVVTSGPPLPTGAEMLAKMENNPPIDAAATRGGKTSQEEWLANEPVKSGGQAKGSVLEPAVEEAMEEMQQGVNVSDQLQPVVSVLRDLDNAPDTAAKAQIFNEAMTKGYSEAEKRQLLAKMKGKK